MGYSNTLCLFILVLDGVRASHTTAPREQYLINDYFFTILFFSLRGHPSMFGDVGEKEHVLEQEEESHGVGR